MTKTKGVGILLTLAFSLYTVALDPARAVAQSPAPSMQLGALPPVPVPSDNPITPQKVELGKVLFFDSRLSGDGSMSCAVCHKPDHGWDAPTPLSPAYPANRERRASMSLVNVAYNTALIWDGRAGALEKQALGPIQNPLHMNMNLDLLMERLKAVPEYVKRFEDVFGSGGLTPENLGKAIAAFERTLVTRDSPFDRSLTGDKKALSPEALKGLGHFQGKARCALCHNGPNFTDQKFHNLGVPAPAALKDPLVQAALRFDAKRMKLEEWAIVTEDPGRYLVTKKEEDRGAFKTPALRNIDQSAPYMHNGAFATLDEVIEFYNQGGEKGPNKSPLVTPLGLTAEEKQQLKAFLHSLTGRIEFTLPKIP